MAIGRIGRGLIAGAALGIAVAVAASRRRRVLRRRVCSDVMGTEACESRHAAKVARIARQLRERKSSAPLSLHKKSPPHQVPKAGDAKYTDEKIDVGDLNEILAIDVENLTCTAEAGVTFVDLVAATMKRGLVPIIVPELKTITVGGAVSGCSIESMSFKHGGFHDTCLEYEVVTAKGEVLRCTPENENSLVFQMVHGTFGTLGIITRLRFRLVPARPFVKVTYEKYANLADFKAAIQGHFERGDVDFMDGILHAPDELVLSVARFVDHAPYTNRYDWMKIYYASTRERAEDYLRTPDYFFRYDHGVTNVHPRSFLGRLLFGKFVGSSQLLRLADKLPWLLGFEKPRMILDVFVPFSKADAFLEWWRKEFDFFPLWCVPYKRVHDYEWLAPRFYAGLDDQLFLDLAIYGMPLHEGRDDFKMVEDKLLEIGGMKTLISRNRYSESDFWKTWNRDNYQRVKARTDPNNIFRDLYDKTCKASQGVGA